MIYIFHGENQPALRDALLELKKGYDEAVFWERELSDLESYLLSPSFFSKKELIIIEYPDPSELPNLIRSIKKGKKDAALIFQDKLPVKKIPKDRVVEVRYFRTEVPKNVFPFLDALITKDKKKALAQAHRLIREGEDPHFLLAMLVWQLRSLTKVKGGVTKGLHPYVLGKLKRLEKSFSEEELSQAFSLLLKEDLNTKRGKADSITFDFLIEKLTS